MGCSVRPLIIAILYGDEAVYRSSCETFRESSFVRMELYVKMS